MRRLSAQDVYSWPAERIQRERARRLDRVKAIRDAAGGSLVNVTDPGEADEVRSAMADVSLLDERLDQLNEEGTSMAPTQTPPAAAAEGTYDFPRPGDGPGSRRSAVERAPVAPSPWTGALLRAAPELAGGLRASVGSFTMPAILAPRVVELGRRNLLAAIPVEPVEGPTFSFLRQTVRTNNAAAVPVAGLKPTSVVTFQQVNDEVSTIATLSEPIPRQYLEDYGALREWIEEDFAYLVLDAIERQVLAGDGTGANLTGILETSGIGVQPLGTDTPADAIRKAITVARVDSGRGPTHVAIRPEDAEALDLAKDTTGRYLFSDPSGGVDGGRIWRLQPVETTGLPAGSALVGDFTGSARIYQREAVRVDWTEAGLVNAADPTDGGLYDTNQVKFRAEARVGLAVLRPQAFVEVTGL
jgi:HK97 family phage major capsid protein